jgi:hypothetical protein
VIMASEVGVLDIPPENVVYKGRLQPGRMFLVDTAQGRIISDEEIKRRWPRRIPTASGWTRIPGGLSDLPPPGPESAARPDHGRCSSASRPFGYTFEDLRVILTPMAQDGVEPVGSMGNDTPLAVLSDKPQLLYNYFKQLFAQVTNPPIDAIREESSPPPRS